MTFTNLIPAALKALFSSKGPSSSNINLIPPYVEETFKPVNEVIPLSPSSQQLTIYLTACEIKIKEFLSNDWRAIGYNDGVTSEFFEQYPSEVATHIASYQKLLLDCKKEYSDLINQYKQKCIDFAPLAYVVAKAKALIDELDGKKKNLDLEFNKDYKNDSSSDFHACVVLYNAGFTNGFISKNKF